VYNRLNPGSFVRFTPESATFHTLLTEQTVDLESLLQVTLMQHTALTEGDWIEVGVPGDVSGPQRLQVMELRPDKSVSLLDTDLEADVTPSREYMDRIETEQAEARAAAEAQAAVEAEELRRQRDAAQVRTQAPPCSRV
jgi:ubiquitin fusion degradation protein 1